MKLPLQCDPGAEWVVYDADGHKVADFAWFSDLKECSENARWFVELANREREICT